MGLYMGCTGKGYKIVLIILKRFVPRCSYEIDEIVLMKKREAMSQGKLWDI